MTSVISTAAATGSGLGAVWRAGGKAAPDPVERAGGKAAPDPVERAGGKAAPVWRAGGGGLGL